MNIYLVSFLATLRVRNKTCMILGVETRVVMEYEAGAEKLLAIEIMIVKT